MGVRWGYVCPAREMSDQEGELVWPRGLRHSTGSRRTHVPFRFCSPMSS